MRCIWCGVKYSWLRRLLRIPCSKRGYLFEWPWMPHQWSASLASCQPSSEKQTQDLETKQLTCSASVRHYDGGLEC
jgi:hypothetical protein